MSFLPDSDSVASFIETSLKALRVECIQAYLAMCKLMEDQSFLIQISDETMVLVFHDGQIDVIHPTEKSLPTFLIKMLGIESK